MQLSDSQPVAHFSETANEPARANAQSIVRSMWKRRRAVFGITVAGTIIALIVVLCESNLYTSATSVMPPDTGTSSRTNLLALAGADVESSILGMKSSGALFVGILKSRNVQDGLISRFGLLARFKKKNLEDARKELSEDTQVAEDSKSGIITVKVTAKDPRLAADLARGYVEELNRVVEQSATSAARRERVFLEERLGAIKKDLDESSKALGQFSSTSAVVQPMDQAKVMMEADMRLQTELAGADAELAGLRQAYSADNVRVRSLEARVAELQRQSGKISGFSTGGQVSSSQLPSLRNLPLLGLTYGELLRRSQTEEMLWATLTKQYEAAKVQEAREIPTVRLLDAADVPLRKSGPQRSRMLLGGALLSFIAGCIVVVWMDFWQALAPDDERKLIAEQIRARYFSRFRGLSRFWPANRATGLGHD